MSLKCHSAFVHYNMFHDRHCHGGGNIIGSVFNITNNCSGNHGGFWSGLGSGIGWGLGNLLGGITGMFGNFGFGGFGMPGMFGGFGFPGFGGFGNFWGGGGNSTVTNDYSRYSSDKSEYKSVHDDKDNKVKLTDTDYADILALNDRAEVLKEAAKTEDKTEEINSLITELENYTKKDDINSAQNDDHIADILQSLRNAPTKPVGSTPANENETLINNKKIGELSADDIATITPTEFNKLSQADKDKLLGKVTALVNDETVAENLAKSTTVPSEIRAIAKKTFYEQGYQNVSLSDLTDAEIGKLKSVIDESHILDFKNIANIDDIKRDVNGNLTSFRMTAQSGKQVEYVKVDVVDGELIFHGKNETQEYALQKDRQGAYHLMQYKYHKGYGTPDVTG